MARAMPIELCRTLESNSDFLLSPPKLRESDFTFLCLSFLYSKVNVIVVPISYSLYDSEMK